MFLRSLDRRYPSTVASNGYDQTLARVRVAFLERLCLDLDAPTIAMAAARVNRKALEVQRVLQNEPSHDRVLLRLLDRQSRELRLNGYSNFLAYSEDGSRP